MPAKTDRILGFLPRTFRRDPARSALYALVNAFGSDLQSAESSLAAVMQSYWVNFADKGADTIDDLARIAALYGLEPRADETVEEFREHLKRYVRTFLEGTVTVQGLLRVSAEALGLRIDDDNLDTWWERAEDGLTIERLRQDNVAVLLFDTPAITLGGSPAAPAKLRGITSLLDGLDFSASATLGIALGDDAFQLIDLAGGVDNPAQVSAGHIVQAINTAFGLQIAHIDAQGHLVLGAPAAGDESAISLGNPIGDAAPLVFGFRPRVYRGQAVTAASITGQVDHSGGVELGTMRFLRLVIDDTHQAEIDLWPGDTPLTTLGQIAGAINNALDIEVCMHDGTFLTIQSPTEGATSSIIFQNATAQDAFNTLFGDIARNYFGQNKQPARVQGQRNLSAGVDLSQNRLLRLQVDDQPATTIDCAGANPANTSLNEIVSTLQGVFGENFAQHDDQFVALRSLATGTEALLVFEEVEGDAADAIFGIQARTAVGADATQVELISTADLSAGVNLWAQHILKLSIDGSAFVELDLREFVADPGHVTLQELTEAINIGWGAAIAQHDGQRLTIRSHAEGVTSRIRIAALKEQQHIRFITRAQIIDEAAPLVLGFNQQEAHGSVGERAEIVGDRDLRHGVDLRDGRFLRLRVDAFDAIDIDCAGARPRATQIDEIVQNINAHYPDPVASFDGHNLVLSSLTIGSGSRIMVEPPHSRDASSILLGIEPQTVFGVGTVPLRFVAMRDLSRAVDLSAARFIKLGVDDIAPIEIDCAGAVAESTSLADITRAINLALGGSFATHDDHFITLTSGRQGEAAQIIFETPDGADATSLLFGLDAPRQYQGDPPTAAEMRGARELGSSIDLSVARFLALAIDSSEIVGVDCAANAADPAAVDPQAVVDAINAAMGNPVAVLEAGRLVLRSTSTGPESRVTLGAHRSDDASAHLLGPVEKRAFGMAAAPATITGEIALTRPINLSERQLLRVRVNQALPVDIPVAGPVPAFTSAKQVVEAVNRVVPGLARLDAEQQLQLIAPTNGSASYLAVQPLRYIDLIEYVGVERTQEFTFRPGDIKAVDASSVTSRHAAIEIHTAHGVNRPLLINWNTRWQIRYLDVLQRRQTLRIWQDRLGHVYAEIETDDHEILPVPADRLAIGPIGAQMMVPFESARRIGKQQYDYILQLVDPSQTAVLLLRGRAAVLENSAIFVSVKPGTLDTTSTPVLPTTEGETDSVKGHIQANDDRTFYLLDALNQPRLQLIPTEDIFLSDYAGTNVLVQGSIHEAEIPLMLVTAIAAIFDVEMTTGASQAEPLIEFYQGVVLTGDSRMSHSLAREVIRKHSRLVTVLTEYRHAGLLLTPGRSRWQYHECYANRYEQPDAQKVSTHPRLSQYEEPPHRPEERALCAQTTCFAGGFPCYLYGIYNATHYGSTDPAFVNDFRTMYAPSTWETTAVNVRFTLFENQAGSLAVSLPADLPERFGGRFNQARFGLPVDNPEVFEKAVTEPQEDERSIVRLINHGHADSNLVPSRLIRANFVPQAPAGSAVYMMPFRKQVLVGGHANAAARAYLTEAGLEGYVVELMAISPGAWGNNIRIAARQTGPAQYDIEIAYEGSRFENARKVVLGLRLSQPGYDLPAEANQLVQPGPIGILQAKGAGTKAHIIRENVHNVSLSNDQEGA